MEACFRIKIIQKVTETLSQNFFPLNKFEIAIYKVRITRYKHVTTNKCQKCEIFLFCDGNKKPELRDVNSEL